MLCYCKLQLFTSEQLSDLHRMEIMPEALSTKIQVYCILTCSLHLGPQFIILEILIIVFHHPSDLYYSGVLPPFLSSSTSHFVCSSFSGISSLADKCVGNYSNSEELNGNIAGKLLQTKPFVKLFNFIFAMQ